MSFFIVEKNVTNDHYLSPHLYLFIYLFIYLALDFMHILLFSLRFPG